MSKVHLFSSVFCSFICCCYLLFFFVIRTMGVATSLSGAICHLQALEMLEVTLFSSQRRHQ
jgi:hypothetical protein